MSSGNRPREQKGARKTGLLEHLEATGAAGQRTMSGSLSLLGCAAPGQFDGKADAPGVR